MEFFFSKRMFSKFISSYFDVDDVRADSIASRKAPFVGINEVSTQTTVILSEVGSREASANAVEGPRATQNQLRRFREFSPTAITKMPFHVPAPHMRTGFLRLRKNFASRRSYSAQ